MINDKYCIKVGKYFQEVLKKSYEHFFSQKTIARNLRKKFVNTNIIHIHSRVHFPMVLILKN